MNGEKELLKMMIINAYVFSGFWCFSLKNQDLEGYMEKLKELFKKEGYQTELFQRMKMESILHTRHTYYLYLMEKKVRLAIMTKKRK